MVPNVQSRCGTEAMSSPGDTQRLTHEPSLPGTEEKCSKPSILLVDDTPENLTAFEAVLASPDQEIVLARSGREALQCVLRQDFAVILMDVNMADIDGFETAT